jgi:hypothetical protein
MSLDPKEVALFIATQGKWSTQYREPDMPRSYKSLRLEGMQDGRNELFKPLSELLPSLTVSSVDAPGTPTGREKVLYADLRDLKKVRACASPLYRS